MKVKTISLGKPKTMVLLSLLFGITGCQTSRDGFDRARAGEVPDGWTMASSGSGSPRWQVEEDPSAPSLPQVLRQSGVADFSLCVQDEPFFADGWVEVKLRAISGRVDQAGGLVWRFQDAANYYLCRANALENNVVLYRVQNGKRKALDIRGRQGGYGVEIPVPAGKWHVLRVNFARERAAVEFNGSPIFSVYNDAYVGPGKVGLWTKADSLTDFDDFRWGASPAR